MKQKSMKKNALLTVFKTIISLIVPLITFPYALRVIEVEGIGKFNFSASVVNYFILFAGLGINTYAIKEGTKLREDREKISIFTSEMLVINSVATVLSEIILLFTIWFIPKLQGYRTIIIILSIQMFFSILGRQWIYNVYEEFGFVTFVQLGVQILSIVLLYSFVNSPADLYKYTILHVISTSGCNILYGIRIKKYVDYKRVRFNELKKHIKPILIIFSTSIATTIYVNSDMTILGLMIDDRCVGLYSTAVKIYNMIKQVIVAVITVTIPRLTLYAGTEQFSPLFRRVFYMLLLLAMPTMTGMFFMSDNIVEIIAGVEYLEAVTALRWLSIALFCALNAFLFGISVLLPNNREELFLKSTVISAMVNIILNIILVPLFEQNAAAFTTALSQGIALLMCYHYSKEYVSLNNRKKPIWCICLGCLAISIVCIAVKWFNLGLWYETIICIILSIIAYSIIQIVLKNSVFMDNLKPILSIVAKK